MNTLSPPISNTAGLHLRMQNVVLGYLFLILPLFDMLSGFMIGQGYLDAGAFASPSQIGRFIGIVLLFASTAKQRYSSYIVMGFVFLGLFELFGYFRHSNMPAIIVGYTNIIRFAYMYLAFVAFAHYFVKDRQSVIRFLKYNVVFVCLSVIFASFTGLANSTYGWGSGTKGFFASGNGLGIYIGVATLILVAMKRYRVYTDINLLVFGLSSFTLVLLGTKTSFLMFVLVVFGGFWSGRFKLVVIPVVLLGALEFFDRISEELITRFDIVILRYKSSSSLIDYVLSGRNGYVERAWADFVAQNPDVLRWLFGGGAFLSYQNPQLVRSFDTLESDVFDVFFMYGLLGLTIYLAGLIFSVRAFWRSPWMLLPVALLWGHSFFAGHVVFNGLGATLLVFFLAMKVSLDRREKVMRAPRTAMVADRRGRQA